MRLIDADDFMKFMTNLEEAGAEHVLFDDLRKFINNQPTAYDVDKVIHRLNSEYDNCVTIDMGAYNYGIDKAIRIVKEQLEG